MTDTSLNELATLVRQTIDNSGVTKVWLADQLDISPGYLQKLLRKKNFTVADANRLLQPLGFEVSYTLKKI